MNVIALLIGVLVALAACSSVPAPALQERLRPNQPPRIAGQWPITTAPGGRLPQVPLLRGCPQGRGIQRPTSNTISPSSPPALIILMVWAITKTTAQYRPARNTYIRTKTEKNIRNYCNIEQKCISLQRVERSAQTGLRHPDNPKSRKPSIIRSPLD